MKPTQGAGSISALSPLTVKLLIWVFVSLLAAALGPFSTYVSMSFDTRLTYWGLVVGSSMMLGDTFRLIVVRWRKVDDYISDLWVVAAMSIVFGTALWLANRRFLGEGFEASGVSWGDLVAVVFLIALGVVGVRGYVRAVWAGTLAAESHVDLVHDEAGALNLPFASQGRGTARSIVVEPSLAQAGPETELPEICPDGTPCPAFLRRLDPALGHEVVSVSADDHYLLVQTECGEGRVLMRFRDALDELAELEGLQIHRSHWVAEGAVARVIQRGRRHMAVLQCGAELPVSQSYLPDLRRTGVVID